MLHNSAGLCSRFAPKMAPFGGGSVAAGAAVPVRGGRFEKEEVCQNTLDY